MIRIYTDGSTRPSNPGPGGWAAILCSGEDDLIDDMIRVLTSEDLAQNQRATQWSEENRLLATVRIMTGCEGESTNNRMELTAVVEAVGALKNGTAATIYSDSEYVVKGAERLPNWKARGWKNTSGAVKNRDLWERFLEVSLYKDITFRHLRGHTGGLDFDSRMNDLCDTYAGRAVQNGK